MKKTNVNRGEASTPAGDKPDETKTTGQDSEVKYQNQKIRAEKEAEGRIAAEAKVAELLALKANGDTSITDEEIAAFAEKHDVDPFFAKDLLVTAVDKASGVFQAKLNAEFAKRDQVNNQKEKDRLFDDVYSSVASDEKYKDIKINKSYVKFIQMNTPEKTTQEIIDDLYGSQLKKEEDKTPADSLENLKGGDKEGETIDFSNATPAQIEKVLEDPELRGKYYAYLDENES